VPRNWEAKPLITRGSRVRRTLKNVGADDDFRLRCLPDRVALSIGKLKARALGGAGGDRDLRLARVVAERQARPGRRGDEPSPLPPGRDRDLAGLAHGRELSLAPARPTDRAADCPGVTVRSAVVAPSRSVSDRRVRSLSSTVSTARPRPSPSVITSRRVFTSSGLVVTVAAIAPKRPTLASVATPTRRHQPTSRSSRSSRACSPSSDGSLIALPPRGGILVVVCISLPRRLDPPRPGMLHKGGFR